MSTTEQRSKYQNFKEIVKGTGKHKTKTTLLYGYKIVEFMRGGGSSVQSPYLTSKQFTSKDEAIESIKNEVHESFRSCKSYKQVKETIKRTHYSSFVNGKGHVSGIEYIAVYAGIVNHSELLAWENNN